MDQALTLRRLATGARAPESHATWAEQSTAVPPGVKVLSFTSGKGGVGKTHIVVNLACALQRLGARVMLLDADLGLANVDVLLGLTPRFTIQHVLEGQKTLNEILVPGPGGILILPASSGVQELADLNDGQRLQLLTALETLEHEIDFLLIDTGAGISANVMYFNVAAQDIIVVATPEPTSITDAYALMKVLCTKYAEKHFKVVMNNVAHAAEGKESFRRLSVVAEKFLNISIDYLGYIPHDLAFSQAVRQQKALFDLYPGSSAAQGFRTLAQRLMQSPDTAYPKGNIQFFWRRLLSKQSSSATELAGR
ncbi:MAG: MinD/ParA family protein [Candidatus Tectimicrobiota bacterium]